MHFISFILAFQLSVFSFGRVESNAFQCQIQITNVIPNKGKVYYALYDRPDAFLHTDKVRFFGVERAGANSTMLITLSDLPAGQYALSCFQDIDDNGYLTKNWAGIPAEPYGFSNQARPKFRAPNWSEAVFTVSKNVENLPIRLEKW